MFILLGNVIRGVGVVLQYFLWAYMWVLVGRAIISWVNADPHNACRRQ